MSQHQPCDLSRKRLAMNNGARVRQLLRERDPGFQARLEAAVRQVDNELRGTRRCGDSAGRDEAAANGLVSTEAEKSGPADSSPRVSRR